MFNCECCKKDCDEKVRDSWWKEFCNPCARKVAGVCPDFPNCKHTNPNLVCDDQ